MAAPGGITSRVAGVDVQKDEAPPCCGSEAECQVIWRPAGILCSTNNPRRHKRTA
jgi:hypothetical protein